MASAAGQLRFFADQQPLRKTKYSRTSTTTCDLCGTALAGHVGYRCSRSGFEFNVHKDCAAYFKESAVSFFAHPWHALKLSRAPTDRRCDLCMGQCPAGSFVYRCVQCVFDVHPLCTLLPQVMGCPLHKGHHLCMSPSSGHCGACLKELPIWHYSCGFCELKLHIDCVSGMFSGGEQGSAGGGGDDQVPTAGGAGGSSQSIVVRSSRSIRVAKFLLKRVFFIAIDSATAGLATPVLQILAEAIMN